MLVSALTVVRTMETWFTLALFSRGSVRVSDKLHAPMIASDVYSECIFFFFQAEDGIRDVAVLEFRRVLFRSQHCQDVSQPLLGIRPQAVQPVNFPRQPERCCRRIVLPDARFPLARAGQQQRGNKGTGGSNPSALPEESTCPQGVNQIGNKQHKGENNRKRQRAARAEKCGDAFLDASGGD